MSDKFKQFTVDEFKAWLKGKKITRKIHDIVVHHFYRPSAKQWKGKSTLYAVQTSDMVRLGASEFPYHFVIAPDGTVWIGRDVNKVGAHCMNHNSGTIGLVFAADFTTDKPMECGYDSGVEVLAALIEKLGIEYWHIKGHRELRSTECPGNRLDMKKLRRSVDIASQSE